MIGVSGENDLDGDFALDERLHGPIDRAHPARADLLGQCVTANRAPGQVVAANLFEQRQGSDDLDRLIGWLAEIDQRNCKSETQ